MKNQDYHHYSELLKPYLESELDAGQAEQVQEHLASCRECTAELRALEVLAVAPGPGLSDLERARLHRAIDEAGAEVSRPGWRTKLVPALSAAALLAIVAIGITTVDFSGSDEDASQGADTASEALRDADAPESQAAAVPEGSLPYATAFQKLGSVSQRRLNALGSNGFLETGAELFASTRSAGDATASNKNETGGGAGAESGGNETVEALGIELQDEDSIRAAQIPSLAALASQASDAGLAAQINDCGQQVLDSHPYLILPVFASTARLQDTPVLVIGFRWREEGPGDLNRYQVWAWPRSSCDVSVYYASGRIR